MMCAMLNCFCLVLSEYLEVVLSCLELYCSIFVVSVRDLEMHFIHSLGSDSRLIRCLLAMECAI
jgi:hypothetical protein